MGVTISSAPTNMVSYLKMLPCCNTTQHNYHYSYLYHIHHTIMLKYSLLSLSTHCYRPLFFFCPCLFFSRVSAAWFYHLSKRVGRRGHPGHVRWTRRKVHSGQLLGALGLHPGHRRHPGRPYPLLLGLRVREQAEWRPAGGAEDHQKGWEVLQLKCVFYCRIRMTKQKMWSCQDCFTLLIFTLLSLLPSSTDFSVSRVSTVHFVAVVVGSVHELHRVLMHDFTLKSRPWLFRSVFSVVSISITSGIHPGRWSQSEGSF